MRFYDLSKKERGKLVPKIEQEIEDDLNSRYAKSEGEELISLFCNMEKLY